MLKNTLLEFFERDLRHLKAEINGYPAENELWEMRGAISNSAGNLCLHLLGNLNHFIGATLGNTGYVRDRDSEFSTKNVPRSELVEAIDHTMEVVRNSLGALSEADLFKEYPLEKHGKVVSTDYMLCHLVSHFNYHLGQINYHRRGGI